MTTPRPTRSTYAGASSASSGTRSQEGSTPSEAGWRRGRRSGVAPTRLVPQAPREGDVCPSQGGDNVEGRREHADSPPLPVSGQSAWT